MLCITLKCTHWRCLFTGSKRSSEWDALDTRNCHQSITERDMSRLAIGGSYRLSMSEVSLFMQCNNAHSWVDTFLKPRISDNTLLIEDILYECPLPLMSLCFFSISEMWGIGRDWWYWAACALTRPLHLIFSMNGDMPHVPITTLAGIASLTDCKWNSMSLTV